jgi:hypothetical protein
MAKKVPEKKEPKKEEKKEAAWPPMLRRNAELKEAKKAAPFGKRK